MVIAMILVVVAVVLLGVFAVKFAMADAEAKNASAGQIAKYGTTPSGVDAKSGSVTVTAADLGGTVVEPGQSSKVAKVMIFEDFQCPACRAFNEAYADRLDSLVRDGKAEIVYQPVAFLDAQSTTKYASRAMNAAVCVLDVGGKQSFYEMVKNLFASQPEEGSAGLTNAALNDLATKSLGKANTKVKDCINDGGYRPFVKTVTDRAVKSGIGHTPTIKVNGTEVDAPESFDQLVANLDAAIAKANA